MVLGIARASVWFMVKPKGNHKRRQNHLGVVGQKIGGKKCFECLISTNKIITIKKDKKVKICKRIGVKEKKIKSK